MPLHHATADEMTELDRIAVDNGLQIRQMMELAGWHMLDVFQRLDIEEDRSVCAVIGKGNKGGDGLAAARHLANHDYEVRVVLMTPEVSDDSQHHLDLVEKMGIPVLTMEDGAFEVIESSDVVIDALIGYHLEGPPRPPFDEAIEAMNASIATVIAYDLPSGADPNTGICNEPCIHADATLSLALAKKVFQDPTGKELSGRVFLADIGIPDVFYDQVKKGSRPPFEPGELLEL